MCVKGGLNFTHCLLSSCPQGFLKGSLEPLNYNNSLKTLFKISSPPTKRYNYLEDGWEEENGIRAKTNFVENLKENADGEGHALSSYEKSFVGQEISFLGQSGSSSLTSAQDSLGCHVLSDSGPYFRILMEALSLRSNLQVSLWNSGKEENSVVHHQLPNNVMSQERRRYNLVPALQRGKPTTST